MPVKVFIDGNVVDREHACISVFDRGFLYGDSVYEVMRTYERRPVDMTAHLDRLANSAAELALVLPERQHIVAAIHKTLDAADNAESYIRVVVTRGGGKIGLDTALAEQPALIIMVCPLVLPPPEAYTQGLKLRIVQVQRTPRRAVDPGVKSGNYLNNIMALHEARRFGDDEAIMCDARGRVAEGSTCNVFVIQGDRIVTPALEIGLLAGITRQRVIELARSHGIAVSEGTITPEEVRAADEVFITSSTRGVVPVATIDGAGLTHPVVGPITRRVMEFYERYLAEQGRG